MTDTARYFLSPSGPYAEEILASDIASRQAALRCGWFIDHDDCPMVYVRRSQDGRRQHFRRIDGLRGPAGGGGDAPPPESPEHHIVKRTLVAAVNAALEAGACMPWGFTDRRFHFPFTGDLLEGVTAAEDEYTIPLPGGRSIRPDVALVGPDAVGMPMVRWAIEVMRGNELDVGKMMKIYGMGLPTIVVDIAGVEIDRITPAWAAAQLSATCASDSLGRRANFIHLPDTLRTVSNAWSRSRGGQQHKFVVFGAEERILSLCDRLRQEAGRLQLPMRWQQAKALGIQPTDIAAPNNTNEQTEKEFQNARRLIPHGWVDLTGDRYLRVVVPRPQGPGPIQDFHISLAHMVAADGEVIMAYESRSASDDDDERTAHVRCQSEDGFWRSVPLSPKVLCYPVGLHRKGLTDRPVA
jgi:hypothetical protein